MHLTAFGLPVIVQVGGSGQDELTGHLLEAWAWCHAQERPDDSSANTAALVKTVLDPDPAVVEAAHEAGAVAGSTLFAVAAQLTPTITAAALAAGAGDLVMLHAAAVTDPETGRTVVLVGPSGAGKSTAVRALSDRFAYVTDETVVFGADLRPRAFAKPISLFPAGRSWGKEQHAPAALGLQRPPSDLTCVGVLFLERTPDPDQAPVTVDLTSHEAVARLAENSSYLSALPRPMHRLAELVRAFGVAHLVGYHEATDLAPLIDQLVQSPATPRVEVPELPLEVPATSEGHGRDDHWQADAHDDFVVVDGYGVAFKAGQVSVISPLGATILSLIADGPLSVDQLTTAVVSHFGAPTSDEGDARDLVRNTLEHLAASRLARTVEPYTGSRQQ